jgi:serine/threonine protein kinase
MIRQRRFLYAERKSDLLEGAPTAKETVEGSAHGTLPVIAVDVVAKSREQARVSGKLGRFDLKELLGQRAYGRVYRAYDPQLDREVALKVPMFGPDDKHKIQRFSAEAKAAARLRHPNIVPTYESGQFGGQYYIAAQFVSGQTLAQRLAQGGPDFRQVADWVGQLADALAHAHRQGIVHRDIKPENIMLDEHEKPLIMDFGLAKRMNEDAAITTDGSILGTPAYMPPEQARGDVEKIGPHSDQYSLGAVLYELLTGKRPFDGPPHSVIAQVLATEPRPPRSIRREIPSDLAALCQVAMSKESADRYPTCSDFAADLARWLGGYETQARPLGQIERGLRWCRRNTLVAGMLASILILLAFGLATTSTLYWTVATHKQQTIAGEKTNPDSSITPLSPNTPITTVVPPAAKTTADADDPPATTKVEFKPLDLTNLTSWDGNSASSIV